jgi:hypothetical protein
MDWNSVGIRALRIFRDVELKIPVMVAGITQSLAELSLSTCIGVFRPVRFDVSFTN